MGLIAASPLIRHVEKWQIARAKSLAPNRSRMWVVDCGLVIIFALTFSVPQFP